MVISACRDLQTPKIGESNKVELKLLQWPKERMVNWRRQVSGDEGADAVDEKAIPSHREGRDYSRVRKADHWSNSHSSHWQSGCTMVIGVHLLKGSHRRTYLAF